MWQWAPVCAECVCAQRNINNAHEHTEQERQIGRGPQAGRDVLHTDHTKARLLLDNRSCHWNKINILLRRVKMPDVLGRTCKCGDIRTQITMQRHTMYMHTTQLKPIVLLSYVVTVHALTHYFTASFVSL
ncbi:hypothetical protein JOB18_004007 [Solea senegalensis]|uniref:Uncharacterized protein n=1 Tax=Solea senegalensis TaxID=28829 RepID=A0AAV6SQ13_SOLSE|nr:hypothetical protein JOB18_004007 [Solea senegalensis]